MKFIQEVTEWSALFTVPNHIYYVNDSKTRLVGYIREGTRTLIKFKKPIDWDRRGRKFEPVTVRGLRAERDEVYFPKEDAKETVAPKNSITVEGSRGSKYILTRIAGSWTCSCPGFGFRRKCRHLELAPKELA